MIFHQICLNHYSRMEICSKSSFISRNAKKLTPAYCMMRKNGSYLKFVQIISHHPLFCVIFSTPYIILLLTESQRPMLDIGTDELLR